MGRSGALQCLRLITALCILFTHTTAQLVRTIDQSSTPTSTAAAATHTVNVGRADHKFEPDMIEAAVGDIIIFAFFPANHSVVRAGFDRPCIPIEMSEPGSPEAFYSGFKPAQQISNDPPIYPYRVTDTDPFYFYCSAPGSCINYQMVGVINPNSTVAFQDFKERAGEASFSLSPGESWPAEDGNLPPSTTTSPPTQLSTSPVNAPSPSEVHKHALSTGATIGIAVGSAGAVLILAILAFFIWRSRRSNKKLKSLQAQIDQGRMSQLPPTHTNPNTHTEYLSGPKSPGMMHVQRESGVGFAGDGMGGGGGPPGYSSVRTDEVGSMSSGMGSPGPNWGHGSQGSWGGSPHLGMAEAPSPKPEGRAPVEMPTGDARK